MGRIIRNDRGQVLAVALPALLLMLGFAGLVLDLGRFLLAHVAAQTMADAASLAGAESGKRWVEAAMTVKRYVWFQVCVEWDENGSCVRREWRRRLEDQREVHEEGYAEDLLDGGGMVEAYGCGGRRRHDEEIYEIECSAPRIVRARIVYPAGTSQVAQDVAMRNTGELRAAGARLDGVSIHPFGEGERGYPSVAAVVRATIPMYLLRFVGVEEIRVTRCAQARTAASGREYEGKIPRPERICPQLGAPW